MKAQLFRSISSTLLFVLMLLLSIRNFKKDPSDNISLFGIVFSTAMIGVFVTIAIIKYRQANKKTG